MNTQARWLVNIHGFRISETVIVSWLIIAGLALASYFLTRNLKKIPESKVQVFLEYAVLKLYNLVETTMGKELVERIPNIVPYIGSLFMYFLCSNLVPLLGLRSPTVDLDTTLALSTITIVLIYAVSIRFNGGACFKDMIEPTPILLPINLVGEIARPISLSFRPFGNILGGTLIMMLFYQLMGFLSTLIPGVNIPFAQFLVPVPLHLYFDIFAGTIQAFIFIMLTMVFISNSVDIGLLKERESKKLKNKNAKHA
ncbi:F0F1 ATP synthase subunit A [Peptacetobacter sp.]|uniref:F0F1 ATP synthase subunit A n=1 Tax=Peptacetobacter sp. TaxID=2991975 RepID=UPI00261EAB0C|nr:FoF1 ATP synthase subunit a [Peptacetobacter sp.]